MSVDGAIITTRGQTRGWIAPLMTLSFLLYTAIILVGHIIAFPLSYALLNSVCAENCGLTADNSLALAHINVSAALYANLYMALQVVYIIACLSVALLIVFKKPGQLVPLGIGFLLVGLSAYEGADYPALIAAYPWLNLPATVLITVVGMGPLATYAIMTFPNGKFTPRWVFWVFLPLAIVDCIPSPSQPTDNDLLSTVGAIVGLLYFPLILFVLIYRFRWGFLNAKERNAAKWVIYSLSIFILMIIFVGVILPVVAPADSLWFLLVNTIGFFGCGINIFGLLMAILYGNAFDIDVLINRTLVYGSLTALLAAVYAGLIIGLESLGQLFTAQATQPVVIVVSTLAIAALFQPLQQRIQNFIDRRFYRRKYDAAKALAAFSAALRSEVDLEQLNVHLLQVVNDTMQPAHVSLWLRPTETRHPLKP
jgi:hypothetical protein